MTAVGPIFVSGAPVVDTRLAFQLSEPPDASLDGWYNVWDYGATGLGVVDETAALQAVIDTVEAVGAGTIWVPPGDYNYTRLDVLASHVHFLLAPGARMIKTSAGVANQGGLWIRGVATATATTMTGAGVGRDATVLAVANGSPFAVDNYVQIVSNATLFAQTPYLIELNQLSAKAAGSLTVKNPTRNAYDVGPDVVTITKITPLFDIQVIGGEWIGAGGTGGVGGDCIRLDYCWDPIVRQVEVTNFGDHGVIFWRCYGGLMDECDGYDGSDLTSHWCFTLHSCEAVTLRKLHAHDTTWDAINLSYGTMYCVIEDPNVHNVGDVGVIMGHGVHGHHNTCRGGEISFCGASGLGMGNPSYAGDDDNLVEGTFIHNCNGGGIQVRKDSARNKFVNVTVQYCAGSGAATGDASGVEAFAADNEFINCVMTNNTIHGLSAAGPRTKVRGGRYNNNGGSGIRVDGTGGGGSAKECMLDRVTADDNVSHNILIIAGADDCQVLYPTTRRASGAGSNGIYVTGSLRVRVIFPVSEDNAGYGARIFEASAGACLGSEIFGGTYGTGNVSGTETANNTPGITTAYSKIQADARFHAFVPADIAGGALVLGADPGSADLLRVTGNARFVGDVATYLRILSVGPNFETYRYNGLVGAPTAVLAGEALGGWYAWGHNGATYLRGGAIQFWAGATNWSGASSGGFMQFSTTDDASITLTARWRMLQAGHWVPATNALYDLGSTGVRVRDGWFSGNVAVGGALVMANLTLTAAASKIIPGVTSLSLRNAADTADNLLILDGGAITMRGSLTMVGTTTYIVPGSTSFAIRNNANTQDNLQVLESTGFTKVIGLSLASTAVGKIIPGATSISHRNNADTFDNLIITDAGNVTIRGTITAGAATFSNSLALLGTTTRIIPGTTSFAVRNNADTQDNLLVIDAGSITSVRQLNISMTAASKIVPGATSLSLRNNADTADNILITDAGIVTVRSTFKMTAAASRIVPGATSLSLRNNADSADNLLITDVGDVTVRADLTVLGALVIGALSVPNLTLTAATSKIIPGVTSLSLRNNADTLDNILVTDAGIVTLRNRLILTNATSSITPGATSFAIRNNANTQDNLLVLEAGSITSVRQLNISMTAASKIVPGATSLSLRNNADSADNVLVTDAGVVTVRSTLKLATAVSKIVPGATSLALRNAADTADNLLVTDAGDVTVRADLAVVGVLTAGSFSMANLTLTAAASKIIPGATSLSLRNTADSADNLLITDAGIVTLRNRLVLTNATSSITPGTTSFAIRNNANTQDNLHVTDAGVVKVLALSLASTAVGKIIPGVTSIAFRNNADSANNLLITDAGDVTVRGDLGVTGALAVGSFAMAGLTLTAAVSQIVPGVTSLAMRNNADTVDNILITDAGIVTFRNRLVLTNAASSITPGATSFAIRNNANTQDNLLVLEAGSITSVRQLNLSMTAASKIVPGATSLSLRNNADSADNILITDAGVTTLRAALTTTQLTLTAAASRLIPGATSFAVRNNANTVDNLSVTDAGVTKVLTLSLASSAVGKIIPGVTSIAFRNNADTVNNLIITDAGDVTIGGDLGVTGALTVGSFAMANLTLTAAASKIIPGATSLSLRNTGDTADNLLISNAGVVTVRSNLVLATAVSKVIPGATSLSFRNNADSADNLIITDAGAVTIRSTLTALAAATVTQLTLTAAASRLIPGATSFAIRNTANTVNNLIVVDSGDVTVVGDMAVGGALSVGSFAMANLTLTAAASKIIPGITSLSLRNTADTADNILITDAGVVTIRSTLKLATASSKIVPGATALSFRNNADAADNMVLFDAGDVAFRGQLQFTTAVSELKAGATSFSVRNNADTLDNILITDAGIVTLRNRLILTNATSGITPGATSFAIRNNANTQDNLLVIEAGSITSVRQLNLTMTAASKIVPGATSLSLRNNADSADNVLIADSGAVTLRASLKFATAASVVVPGATSFNIRNNADSATNLALTDAGLVTFRNTVNLTAGALQMAGVQVLGPRITGWAAATGTADRTTFVTSTVTLPELAKRVKALIDDWLTHGAIGA